VQSSVYKDRQFEIDALRSTKPVKTCWRVKELNNCKAKLTSMNT